MALSWDGEGDYPPATLRRGSASRHPTLKTKSRFPANEKPMWKRLEPPGTYRLSSVRLKRFDKAQMVGVISRSEVGGRL
jgi:hypothetical protein